MAWTSWSTCWLCSSAFLRASSVLSSRCRRRFTSESNAEGSSMECRRWSGEERSRPCEGEAEWWEQLPRRWVTGARGLTSRSSFSRRVLMSSCSFCSFTFHSALRTSRFKSFSMSLEWRCDSSSSTRSSFRLLTTGFFLTYSLHVALKKENKTLILTKTKKREINIIVHRHAHTHHTNSNSFLVPEDSLEIIVFVIFWPPLGCRFQGCKDELEHPKCFYF